MNNMKRTKPNKRMVKIKCDNGLEVWDQDDDLKLHQRTSVSYNGYEGEGVVVQVQEDLHKIFEVEE